MNNNTAMPTIAFSADADYDALFCVLRLLEWSLDVHLADGTSFFGTYFGEEGDTVTFRLYDEDLGDLSDETKTVDADDIVRIEIA